MNYRIRIVDLHIVDALETKWAQIGFSESMALHYRLRNTRINIVSHYCWDIQSLKSVIKTIMSYRVLYRHPRRAIPYLHIASHGIRDGLSLGDSTPLPWSALSECLLPLQRLIDYTLPLSLSSCHGFYGYQLACQGMAGYEKKRPYYSLVGPKHRLKTRELFEAYAEFYLYLLHRYTSIKVAIDAANKKISKPAAYLDFSLGAEVQRNFEAQNSTDEVVAVRRKQNS